MATPPADPNTAVFPGFSVDNIHLYFTLAKEGGSFPSCSPHSLRSCHSARFWRAHWSKKLSKTQLILRWGVERPIQFILHIKGLKCGRLLLAQSICREDHTHSMLPNQWQPYGRQKVRHNKQTNKEVRPNIMLNGWLCPSQQPATTSWIELLKPV